MMSKLEIAGGFAECEGSLIENIDNAFIKIVKAIPSSAFNKELDDAISNFMNVSRSEIQKIYDFEEKILKS